MNLHLINKLTCVTIGIAMVACNTSTTMEKLTYPNTKKVDTTDIYFGTEVSDPYRWLEDDMSAETKDWVVEQNKVTDAFLDQIPYRKAIEDRLTQIWNYEKIGTPFKKAELLVYAKNDGLQNQSIYYYKKTTDDEEKVLIDPNKLSEDGTVSLGSFSISDDGRYLGYTISRGGSDWREIFVKDIESGKLLDDHIQWVKFSGISWFKNGFFYTRFDTPKEGDELKGENKNPKVYYHQLGDEVVNDAVIFDDPAHPDRISTCSVTDDHQYLVLYQTESTSGNALYIKDLTTESAEIVKVVDDFEHDHRILDHSDGVFLLSTNYGAPKERIVKFSLKGLNKDEWLI